MACTPAIQNETLKEIIDQIFPNKELRDYMLNTTNMDFIMTLVGVEEFTTREPYGEEKLTFIPQYKMKNFINMKMKQVLS